MWLANRAPVEPISKLKSATASDIGYARSSMKFMQAAPKRWHCNREAVENEERDHLTVFLASRRQSRLVGKLN
jgi:hypothetical protein